MWIVMPMMCSSPTYFYKIHKLVHRPKTRACLNQIHGVIEKHAIGWALTRTALHLLNSNACSRCWQWCMRTKFDILQYTRTMIEHLLKLLSSSSSAWTFTLVDQIIPALVAELRSILQCAFHLPS